MKNLFRNVDGIYQNEDKNIRFALVEKKLKPNQTKTRPFIYSFIEYKQNNLIGLVRGGKVNC